MPITRVGVVLTFSIMLLLASTSMAYASTIVVDPAGGPDVERSIGAAIARAADGDTIIVHSGTYYEEVYVDRRITLAGVDTGGGRPVIDGSRLNYRPDVTITAGNATLHGFSIRNGILGIAINEQYNPSITGVSVYDNLVSDIYGTAIGAEYTNASNITGNMLSGSTVGISIGSFDNVISDNRIFNMSEAGISVAFSSRNLITGNMVHNCPEDGIDISGPLNNVDNNLVWNCGTGIFVAKSGNEIEDNTVYQNDEGIRLQKSNDGLITGNLAYGNTCGLKLVESRYNNITNNTFRDNTGEAINGDDTLNFNQFSANAGVTLPPFRYYSDGSPYIAPSTPAGGATVYVGGPEGQGTGNDPHQIATVVWPAPPDGQIVYVNLYCTPKKMSATNPGTGWGMLTFVKAKAWGCVSV
jgi:parallel beta-helix repeat protein